MKAALGEKAGKRGMGYLLSGEGGGSACRTKFTGGKNPEKKKEKKRTKILLTGEKKKPKNKK